jgi:hypothetical protein
MLNMQNFILILPSPFFNARLLRSSVFNLSLFIPALFKRRMVFQHFIDTHASRDFPEPEESKGPSRAPAVITTR